MGNERPDPPYPRQEPSCARGPLLVPSSAHPGSAHTCPASSVLGAACGLMSHTSPRPPPTVSRGLSGLLCPSPESTIIVPPTGHWVASREPALCPEKPTSHPPPTPHPPVSAAIELNPEPQTRGRSAQDPRAPACPRGVSGLGHCDRRALYLLCTAFWGPCSPPRGWGWWGAVSGALLLPRV